MDLNFIADQPPIPADWLTFQPRVTPDAAPAALAEAADAMRSNEVLTTGFKDDLIEEAARPLTDPEVVALYASGVPMVARFLTIELDTEHEIGKGIGRVAPGDPPPRFGEKYRKKLRDEAVADEFGTALENLALHGFAAHAAVNACADEPAGLREADLSERWRVLTRYLNPTWLDLTERLQMDESAPDPLMLLMLGVAQPAADEYALLAERLKLGGRRPFGKARAASYLTFFLTLGWLVFDTGTDRRSDG